ncbi:hypothetical protein L208DRAFT_1261766, partial [Tricholoma matsutake]
ILGIGKGILRVFSLDFPLLGASPIPVICSIILTSDFPLLEAEVALIVSKADDTVVLAIDHMQWNIMFPPLQTKMQNSTHIQAHLIKSESDQINVKRLLWVEVKRFIPVPPSSLPEIILVQL